jgi:hypothetical protein
MNKMMMNDDIDIENTGIMQGFLDALSEDDEGDDEDERSPEEMLDRRPDTPEILMNNLRGDMRSIDARRDELADLVGYAAAAETPETVLAMLQPVLAQQGGGGIGALPQSAPMAEGPQPPMMEGMPGMPPPGMPPLPEGAPPMMPGADMAPPPAQDGGIAALLAGIGGAGGSMPPGMPPSDQPPIQMARGGYVQRFSKGSTRTGVTAGQEASFNEGSDEDDVTPDGETSSLGFDVPPEMVEKARAQFLATMQSKPTALPNLQTAAAERAKVYQDILGDNTDSRQAQMLLSLGQRAFGYAANVDDAGRPLRGSGFSRLAGAVRTLPGEMAQYISAADKEQRQTKLLGLQAAEKDIESTRASNLRLLEVQRKGYADVLKSAGKGSENLFGSGLDGRSLGIFVKFAPEYARGETTPEQDRQFEAAITNYTQPTYMPIIDPVEKTITGYQETRKQLPPFMVTAIETRKGLPAGTVSPVTEAPVTTAPVGAAGSAPVTVPLSMPIGAGGTEAAPVVDTDAGAPISLWNNRFKVSGPVSAAIGVVSGIPGLGDPAADITLARQQARQQAERIVNSLLKSTQGSVREQERLRPVIGIIPNATLDPDAYGTKLIALGSTLRDMIKEYEEQGREGSGLSPADKADARQRASALSQQYNNLGLPPAVFSVKEFNQYDPGTEVLWMGKTPARVKPKAK